MSNQEHSRQQALDAAEQLKAESRFLRGDLHISLEDPITGAVSEDDTKLIKFHGIYQQDDRDLRLARKRARLEPLFTFMLRVRIPGGVLSSRQWLALDALARRYGSNTLRLTTRQAVQFHRLYKEDLRAVVQALEAVLLDSLAACGDVNRNVMCSPNPRVSALHQQVQRWTEQLAERLLPRTTAYREVWLGETHDPAADSEPLYGATYLPRKFKTAVAVPPVNDVDVFAHDLGFIAIAEGEALQGFNVTVGGGMGMSHERSDTWPRLADVLAFCKPDQALAVAEIVVAIQRDYGNRSDRKRARLKYTIAERGIDWFRTEVERCLVAELEAPRGYAFEHNGDRYGWREGLDGRRHFTAFVENGRLNRDALDAVQGLLEKHAGIEVRLSPNQNLLLAGVSAGQSEDVETAMRSAGLSAPVSTQSALRRNAMACVAMPTCPLAMAEAERYLPELITRIDERLRQHGLQDEPITLRMTGCPNGCARPYLAEIGLVGKAPGRYNLYLGAAFDGSRLNRLHRENANEEDLLAILDELFARFAAEREAGEHFGDYLIRAGITQPVVHGEEVRQHVAA